MDSGTGDQVSASIEDSTNVTVGKGNRQQVVHVDARADSVDHAHHERFEYLLAMLERRVLAIEIALQIGSKSTSLERAALMFVVVLALLFLAVNVYIQIQVLR